MIWGGVFSKIRPFFLMGGSMFFNLILATIIVGWQALRTILIEDGVYSNLCQPHNSTSITTPITQSLPSLPEPSLNFQTYYYYSTTPCVAQSLRLDLMFVISTSLLNLTGLITGILVDVIGPRILGIMLGVLFLVGELLFAFSDSVTFDAYLPAMVIMSCSGIGIVMCLVTIPNLFHANYRPFLSTALMSSQDTGAIVFWIFQILYYTNKEVFSIRNLFVFHTLAPLSFILFSFFIPGSPVKAIESEQMEKVDEKTPLTKAPEKSITEEPQTTNWKVKLKENMLMFLKQLCSTSYLALVIWGSVGLTATYFFMTTLSDQLYWIGGKDFEFASTGTFVFSIMMVFVGLSSILVTGLTMRYFGLLGGILVVGFMNLTTFIIIIIPVQSLQYVGMVTLIIGRASLFGVWLQYVLETLTSHHSTLIGISTLSAGIVNLTNYIWTYIAKVVCGGDFFYVNIGMGIAILLSTALLFSIVLFQKVKKKGSSTQVVESPTTDD